MKDKTIQQIESLQEGTLKDVFGIRIVETLSENEKEELFLAVILELLNDYGSSECLDDELILSGTLEYLREKGEDI